MSLRAIQPPEWGVAQGYSHAMLAPAGSRLLFVSGQIGWDANQKLVSAEFAGQFEQALANVLTILHTAGGAAPHIGRLTIYVADRHKYSAARKQVGRSYRNLMGNHYPAMALLEVQALLEPGALVEIEATATLP